MRYTHVEENEANNAVAGDWCLKWSGKCGEVYHHPVPCPAANSAPALPSLPTINSVPAFFTTLSFKTQVLKGSKKEERATQEL